MRRSFILLVTSLLATFCTAQRGIAVDQGAYSSAIGGINTVLGSSDAILGNFSMFTDRKSSSFLVSTSRRFALSELASYSVGAHLPLKKHGHLGLSVSSYGFEAYKEQQFLLQYARRLGENLSISGKLGYQNLTIQDNGSKGLFLFGLGISGSISESLSYGLVISNPESLSITESTPLISEIKFGLAYSLSEKVISYSEVEKTLEESMNFKVGVNYKIHTLLSLRAGFSTNPGNSSFGFGYKITTKLRLDAAFIYDSLLGISPVLTLKWVNSQNLNEKR